MMGTSDAIELEAIGSTTIAKGSWQRGVWLLIASSLACSVPQLGACYNDDSRRPSDIVRAFYRAANEGKYSLAEQYISTNTVDALKTGRGAEQGGIQGACDTLTRQGRLDDVEILSEKLRGEGAEIVVRIRYKDHEERQAEHSLVREHGAWKLNIRVPDPTTAREFAAVSARGDIARGMISRNGAISKALESYKWDTGEYPDTRAGLAALFQPKGKDNERYNGPYLDGVFEQLTDPWGQPFEYRSPGNHNPGSYDLWSRGLDLKDDGGERDTDDIVNWARK